MTTVSLCAMGPSPAFSAALACLQLPFFPLRHTRDPDKLESNARTEPPRRPLSLRVARAPPGPLSSGGGPCRPTRDPPASASPRERCGHRLEPPWTRARVELDPGELRAADPEHPGAKPPFLGAPKPPSTPFPERQATSPPSSSLRCLRRVSTESEPKVRLAALHPISQAFPRPKLHTRTPLHLLSGDAPPRKGHRRRGLRSPSVTPSPFSPASLDLDPMPQIHR
ncbi:hypothetical protein U9M48_027761 [Paspalum notatum var. saurae]|uniref:Uncharacterized protein n=1 Tax=Paspalum notatum var. saurae TaxID=547442 RepID=A0AAQ3TZG7_PASNO